MLWWQVATGGLGSIAAQNVLHPTRMSCVVFASPRLCRVRMNLQHVP